MKKVMKKAVVLLMAMTMLVSAVAGCGSGGGGNNGKPITLTVYSQLANFSGEQLGWSAQILKERWNVVMNIVPDTDGIYETRMESGNLGDICIFGSDGADYQNAINAGMLYDWEEDDLLHEYGPYIEEHMQNALMKNRTVNPDGKIHGFAHGVATSPDDLDAFIYTWDLRWDLYKQLGYPEYNTLDEFVDILEAMHELQPLDDNGNPTYAVGLWPDWDGTMVMYVKSMATAFWGYEGDFQLGLYDCDTGEYYGALEEGGPYLESLRFFNQLNQRGLIDPNSMTNTYTEMEEKLRASGYFFSIFDYSGSAIYNEQHINDVVVIDGVEYTGRQMLPWAPGDATPAVGGLSTLGSNRVWTIGANTEYPELCMEIINWFCTPEGTMTYNYGPQGLCWDYDEDGHPYFTDFGKEAYFNRDTLMVGDYEGTGTFNDGCFQFNNTTWTINADNLDSNGDKFNYLTWPSYQTVATCSIEQDWRDYTGTTNKQEYMTNRGKYKVIPVTLYNDPGLEGEDKTTWEAVTDIIVTYTWRAIYAPTDEEFNQIVAEMIEQANGYGYARCMEIFEEQAALRHAAELDVTGGN